MIETVSYQGSPKHKRQPHLYDLPQFQGRRGDATLCDDTGFGPMNIADIVGLMHRGIRAGLISDTKRIIWTVADDGWIFEARETNRDTAQFHGYPVLSHEVVSKLVYRRYDDWVKRFGSGVERDASEECRKRYRFK